MDQQLRRKKINGIENQSSYATTAIGNTYIRYVKPFTG